MQRQLAHFQTCLPVEPVITWFCDVCGMDPIVGPRYHQPYEDRDLCETDFLGLGDEERAKYEKIEAPKEAAAAPVAVGPDDA